MKYTLIINSGIYTQIAMETERKGYTIGVMEAFKSNKTHLKHHLNNQLNPN